MKIPITALIVLFSLFSAFAGDIVPNDPKTPLFVIYEHHFDSQPSDAAPHTWHGHTGKALLTVYSLDDLLLEQDKMGVRVILNQKDTRTFAELTHKYEFLALLAGDSAGVTMHISAPIENGSILFDHTTYSENVAAYLRKRYLVKPHSNEFKHSQQ
jgi:hypothetical protein